MSGTEVIYFGSLVQHVRDDPEIRMGPNLQTIMKITMINNY